MKSTLIKVGSLGAATDIEKLKRVEKLASQISKDVGVYCSTYGDELICDHVDKPAISEYLFNREIDHR